MELAYKESLLLFIAMQSRTQVSTNTFTCFVSQSCPALCDPMDCKPPGSSVYADSPGKNTGVGCHAPFRGSSQPRDWIQVSHIAGGFFTIWVKREALCSQINKYFLKRESRGDLLSIVDADLRSSRTVMLILESLFRRDQCDLVRC